jgi:glycosyltransferase involved in cell wall biosynthesis
LAISKAVVDDILRYTGDTANVTLIHDGVLRLAQYDALARPAEVRLGERGPFTFVLMGLIHPSKGQVEAVEALALLRDRGLQVRLVIAGSGRDKPLRERIASLKLEDRVELTGYVNDPFPLFKAADANLVCSRHEAFGRVTVEAMACGLPVIGHASGGTAELVREGLTGLLYPGGAEELADRMARLVTDPGLADRMGRAGAADARDRFTIEQDSAQVLKVYREVLAGR